MPALKFPYCLHFSHNHRTVKLDRKLLKVKFFDVSEEGNGPGSKFDELFDQAHGALIVFDVTQKISKVFASKLLHLVRERQQSANRPFAKLLLANKADCDTAQRQVSYQEGEDYAKTRLVEFYEVSGATGTNVKVAFEAIVMKYFGNGQSSTRVVMSDGWEIGLICGNQDSIGSRN